MLTTPRLIARQNASASPDQAAVLAQVASYLETYEHQFGAAIAEESYSQSAVHSGTLTERRKLTSDLMLLDIGGDWVEFRDVSSVDGKGVRDHQARLQALLSTPGNDPLAAAQRIADESARYNLGAARNINVPTMALAFLAHRAQTRSTFSLQGSAILPAGRALVLAFTEISTPTLIRARTTNVTTHGRAWIAPDTGAVLQTELSCAVPGPWSVSGVITVTYALERRLGLYAPVRMVEQYTLDNGEVDCGEADLFQLSHLQRRDPDPSGRRPLTSGFSVDSVH